MTPVELILAIIVSICCTRLMLNTLSTHMPLLIVVVIMVLCTNASYSTTSATARSAKKAGVADVKQCRNPRFESSEETKGEAKEGEPKERPKEDPTENLAHLNTASMNHDDYSVKNHQTRRDAFIFQSPVRDYQSRSSRESMLNSLYQELLDTSVKSDPGLRAQNVSEKCAPMRGVKENSTV